MPRHKKHIPLTITFIQKDGTKDVFIRGKELGRGSFSTVYRVTHQSTNTIYAMKVISKNLFLKNKSSLQTMRNEIRIQNIVEHPNVVTSQYSFSDKHNYYFALEYCPGRTVREYLNKSQYYLLREPEARKILKDVIQGLEYVHGRGITHYDIKLENFVIDSEGNVKIGDFGLSEFHKNEEGKKFEIFGTLNYLSPEMLLKGKREDTSKVDIWAVGVSAFYLLTGKGPFEGKTKETVFKNIKKGEYQLPLDIKISEEAVDFIKKILQTDPHKRPTAKDLLKHPFLTKVDKETVNLYRESSLPLKKSIVQPKVVQTELPRIDTNLDTTTESDDHLKTVCGPQINDKISFARKKDSLKTYCCQPLNDIRPISPRKANPKIKPQCSTTFDGKTAAQSTKGNDDLKTFCSPVKNDKESVLPAKENDDLKTFGCHPIEDIKPVSSRKANDKMRPKCSPAVDGKPPALPAKEKDDLKTASRPQVEDAKPSPPRKTSAIIKPVCRPPEKDVDEASPRQKNANLNPACCPPLEAKKSGSPRKSKADFKPTCILQQNDVRPISPRIFVLPNPALSPRNSVNCNNKQGAVKSFNIPNHFVSRYCFYKDDLCYLLIDGTVGVCFRDKSRIVMDPNEQFAQFYKNTNTRYPDIIKFAKIDEGKETPNVSLVKKVSANFKKIRFSYDSPTSENEPGVLLHNVVSYVKNDESILFKLDDKNFQVNFSDRTKMIIFLSTKKVCFFKSIREKCSLLDVKSVASMNSNSEELRKFKKAKILLSNFAQTLC